MSNQAHRAVPNAPGFTTDHLLRINIFKTAALASALFIPLTGTLVAKTIGAPPITVNGHPSLVTGLETNNSTFVPIRGIFDKIGATVTFTAPSSLRATKNGSEIAHLTVGSRDAVANGSRHQLVEAPFMKNGTVMVPLRFLSEAAGASVGYSASPRSVQIRGSSDAAAATKSASAAAAEGAVAATGTAAATDAAATATAAPAADTQTNQGGIPWWVWLLAALIIIGIIFALMRRKKGLIITTRGTGQGGDPVIKTRH